MRETSSSAVEPTWRTLNGFTVAIRIDRRCRYHLGSFAMRLNLRLFQQNRPKVDLATGLSHVHFPSDAGHCAAAAFCLAGYASVPSNTSHRLQPCPRADLALRHRRRLRAEALDDAAHERADAGRGDQHRRFAFARGGLELLAHQGDELGRVGMPYRRDMYWPRDRAFWATSRLCALNAVMQPRLRPISPVAARDRFGARCPFWQIVISVLS
jgi:hypothetical protein